MPTTTIRVEAIKVHEPHVSAYDCETCNDVHQDWSCACGWALDMSTGQQWMDHLLEALTREEA